MEKISEKIDRLMQYFDELAPLKKIESDILHNVKDNTKGAKIKITRNGKEFEVDEEILWLEVRHGANTNAREILKTKYPEVFEACEKREKLQDEMVKFAVLELDINPEAIEFSKLVNFIIALVDWRIDRRTMPEVKK